MSKQGTNKDIPQVLPRPTEDGQAWLVACPGCGAEADIDNQWLSLALNRETLCCNCRGRYIIVQPEATGQLPPVRNRGLAVTQAR